MEGQANLRVRSPRPFQTGSERAAHTASPGSPAALCMDAQSAGANQGPEGSRKAPGSGGGQRRLSSSKTVASAPPSPPGRPLPCSTCWSPKAEPVNSLFGTPLWPQVCLATGRLGAGRRELRAAVGHPLRGPVARACAGAFPPWRLQSPENGSLLALFLLASLVEPTRL